MGVTAVFIDGGYLDKVTHRDHAGARLDFQKLAQVMSQLDDLLRRLLLPLYALSKQSSNP